MYLLFYFTRVFNWILLSQIFRAVGPYVDLDRPIQGKDNFFN